MTDPIDWDRIHDGQATEDDFLNWAEDEAQDNQ